MIKRHIEYPITNNDWVLTNRSLWSYLLDIVCVNSVVDPLKHMDLFYVDEFYIRKRLISGRNYDEQNVNKDPWSRKFVVMKESDNGYVYKCFTFPLLKGQLHIIVTTVNGLSVYCVDLVCYDSVILNLYNIL